jgi:hypothetical protein
MPDTLWRDQERHELLSTFAELQVETQKIPCAVLVSKLHTVLLLA